MVLPSRIVLVLDMRTPTVIANVALVISAGIVPRLGAGGEAMGDPILQILYVALVLPVLACFVNLRVKEQPARNRDVLAVLATCAIASIVWYVRWVILTGATPFATGAETQFAVFALFSGCFASLVAGILRVTRSRHRHQQA